mmetsp:Transcript_22858/g.52689  ORF Transcript_22858/g.52689 Transcript_22858/m.52689 type:complete len:565 (-) Transcript_22858:651-2345(-)
MVPRVPTTTERKEPSVKGTPTSVAPARTSEKKRLCRTHAPALPHSRKKSVPSPTSEGAVSASKSVCTRTRLCPVRGSSKLAWGMVTSSTSEAQSERSACAPDDSKTHDEFLPGKAPLLKTVKQRLPASAAAHGTTRTSCCMRKRSAPKRKRSEALPPSMRGDSLGAEWSMTYTSLVKAPLSSSRSRCASYMSELACTQSARVAPKPELMSTLVGCAVQLAHRWLLMYHDHTTWPAVSISSTASTYSPSSSSQTSRPRARACSQSRRCAVSAKRVPVPRRTSRSCASNWWWKRWLSLASTTLHSARASQSYAEMRVASPGSEIAEPAPSAASSSIRSKSPLGARYAACAPAYGVRHECTASPLPTSSKYTSVVERGEYSSEPGAGALVLSVPTVGTQLGLAPSRGSGAEAALELRQPRGEGGGAGGGSVGVSGGGGGVDGEDVGVGSPEQRGAKHQPTSARQCLGVRLPAGHASTTTGHASAAAFSGHPRPSSSHSASAWPSERLPLRHSSSRRFVISSTLPLYSSKAARSCRSSGSASMLKRRTPSNLRRLVGPAAASSACLCR